MADTSTRQYNLQSGKQQSLQFPVQIHLEDGKFLTELLKKQNKQVLDSESSTSDADCEALIASDQASYVEHFKSSSPKGKVASSNTESTVTQEVINVKILSQLEKLGKRLDNIENIVVKQNVMKPKSQKVKRKIDSLDTVSPSGHVSSSIS